MNCEEVRHFLSSGGEPVGREQIGAAIAHVETCSGCSSTWDTPESSAGAALPPARPDDHLWPEQLDALADYHGGPVSDEQRRCWAHVLVCADCYASVAALRAPPVEESDVDLSAEDIWQEIQGRLASAVVVGLIGGVFQLLRWRGVRALPPRPAVRGGRNVSLAQPVEVTWTLRGYELVISIGPDEADHRRSRLGVKVTPPDARLRLVLSRGGHDLHDLQLSGDRATTLPALLPGDYELLLRRGDVEVVGRVSISIEQDDPIVLLQNMVDTPLFAPGLFAGGGEELALVASDEQILLYRWTELPVGISIAFRSDLMPLENLEVGVTWLSPAGEVVRRSAPLRPYKGRLEAYIEAVPHGVSPTFWMPPPGGSDGGRGDAE